MSITATDFSKVSKRGCADGKSGPRGSGQAGPAIDETAWGFVIRARRGCGVLRARMQTLTRFLGTFSMAAIAAILVMSEDGALTMAVALKTALIFAVALGVALMSQAGANAQNRVFDIDSRAGEIRVGNLRHDGDFSLAMRLPFAQVHSVYLYRTKERSRPARLFVRLDEDGTALEVARGPEPALETLRGRLAQTLAPQA